MPKTSPMTELLSLSVADLQRDISRQKMTVAKMRMDIELRKEQDSAKYRREKKQLSRLETALTSKRAESLRSTKNSSTVPARAAGTPRKKGASRASARSAS